MPRKRDFEMAPSKSDIETTVKSGQRRKITRPLIWSLVLLAVGLSALWYWSSGSSQDVGAKFTTEPARISDIVVVVSATGTVEPTNKVEVSSELSGIIKAVEADDNDEVKGGQILARLDTSRLEATVEHSRATLAVRKAKEVEAEATLEEMQSSYDRALQLQGKGIASMETLLTAKAALQRARASLLSAKAEIRVAEADLKVEITNLDKACICSPIDGIVLQRDVEVGQIVASSLQAPILFTIAEDLRNMEIQIDIDEADIGKVAVGNTSSFTVEAYQGQVFPAVISELRYMPETIDGVVTYKAVLSIKNEDLLLRPGMTATAEIIVAEIDDALIVPNAALRFVMPADNVTETEGGSGLLGLLFKNRPSAAPTAVNEAGADGKRTLWVLRGQEAVAVEVLAGASDGSVTEIREGALSAGDAVITDVATQP